LPLAHLLLHVHQPLLALVLLANLLLLGLNNLQLLDVELLRRRGERTEPARATAARRASSAATAISDAFSSASCLMNCTICGPCASALQRVRAGPADACLQDLLANLRVVHLGGLRAQRAAQAVGAEAGPNRRYGWGRLHQRHDLQRRRRYTLNGMTD